MARAKKTDAPDLRVTYELSVGLIERLACPAGVPKAFLRDKDVTGLRVRVTANGAKSFVFEAKLNGKAISRTLGKFPLMAIEEAKDQARELARTIKNDKQDPRELERQQDAAKAAIKAAAAVQAVTVGDVWPRYLIEGKPKRKEAFKPRYRADLEAMAAPGGEKKKRGEGNTRPGPLFPLLALALPQVNEDTLKSWYDREALTGQHQAARALMMFRGFMRWCSARPEYRALIDRDAGKAAAIVEGLPSNTRRTDALEAAQVPGWWNGVEQLNNRTASVYLRALLLTGARREEMAALKWADVDFQWRKLTIADKVEATRVIPLTPYLAQQLATLPRINEFVFASTGKAGRIADTRASHAKALQSAGIDSLTIHGLRRSFSLLGEAAGAPAGAIAQVMGHKPSATAEGYRPRSVDALRPYLAQIESHILEQAGIVFDAKAAPGALRVVAG
jgi:integrase